MTNKLITEIISLAENAGAAIMELYERTNYHVIHKADQSPLTLADTAANRIIEEGLKKLTPDLPIISEESAIPVYQERKMWRRYWLIDPLDGTKEFINKNGEFTVNIALIEDGCPALGVVFAPAVGLCYFASKGEGAFLKTEGQIKSIFCKKTLSDADTIAVSRSHIDKETQALLNKINHARTIHMGSSLKLCLIAEGRVDCYPRLAPTMEWDTGAAHAILNEAGGCIIAANGKELIYNKEDIKNPSFIASERSNSLYWLGICSQ